MDLFFDKEFRSIIPPLEPEEYTELEQSIIKYGNLVPVVVWKEKQLLLDGHHRYDLCHKHGKELKPPTEMSFSDRESAMVWIINNQLGRRNLSDYSRIGLIKIRTDILVKKDQAKAKQGKRTDLLSTVDKRSLPPPINIRKEIAAAAKVSTGTVAKFDVIEQKATAEQKAKLRTGKKTINQIYVDIHRDEVKQSVAKRTEWPSGKYRIIYADPPWQYANDISADKFNDSRLHYPTMPLAEICSLPIKDLSLEDSVLFLWVTSPMLEDAFKVITAWGFHYKTSFVWDKLKAAFGHYNGVRHEFLLVAVRGSCQPDVSLQPDSVQPIPKSKHSAKPEEFRHIIDSLYPNGPRIELFARFANPGWEAWGNEVSRG